MAFREYKFCECTTCFHPLAIIIVWPHPKHVFSGLHSTMETFEIDSWYHVYKEVWTSNGEDGTLVDSCPKGPGRGKRSSFLKYLKRAMWLLLVLLTICHTHNQIFCATICHAHNYKKFARDIFTMELNSWNSQKFSNANVSQYRVCWQIHEHTYMYCCTYSIYSPVLYYQ